MGTKEQAQFKGLDIKKNFPELSVEVCGCYVWVSGNTRPYSERLKADGLRFQGEKQMWYWRPADFKYRKRSGRIAGIDYIRMAYGYEPVNEVA